MLVLVVEDDKRVADFLTRGLREEGHVVDHCTDGATAIEQGTRLPYEFVLMDWNLPSGDGVSVIRALRAAGVLAPVIMLTARSGVDATIIALDAGADDYLTKPFHFEELLARMRSLQRRSAQAESSVGSAQIGSASLDLRRRVLIHPRSGEEALSAREFALLDLLLRDRGEVVTRTRILDRVWGVHYDTTTNVVDVYIRYLRQKLHSEATDSVIETIRGRGYRLRTQKEIEPSQVDES
jgi:two-component system OmpR family response regulator